MDSPNHEDIPTLLYKTMYQHNKFSSTTGLRVTLTNKEHNQSEPQQNVKHEGFWQASGTQNSYIELRSLRDVSKDGWALMLSVLVHVSKSELTADRDCTQQHR